MSRILRRLLWWSGGATILVFLAPSLIVFASLALIIPGLVLAAMPTVFLYAAVFSTAWFGLHGISRTVAAAVGAALVGAVAFVLPEAINTVSAVWLEEAAKRDHEPPAPVGRVARIGLGATGETWSASVCNDLCQLLLLNGSADEVIALTRPDEPAPAARSRAEPRRPTLFRLASAATCPDAETVIKTGNRQSWTQQGAEIAKAARLRVAGGVCLSGLEAGDAEPDLVIRRVEERIGTRPGRLALAPAAAEIKVVEITAGKTLVARSSSRHAAVLTVPLHLVPYGYGMSLDGWEWSRKTRWREPLDVVPVLKRLTSFDLDVPREAGGTELRARLDAALANPALPPDHPALQLVTDYYDVLRKDGLKQGDRERLIRLIGDDRVTRFWHFPYDFVRSADGPAPKDAILDRLLRLNSEAAGESYKALEQLTRALPDGAFREPDGRVDALLAERAGRARSPNLVYRLSDQGAAVAGRLVGIMREGWAVPATDPRKRRDTADGGALSALEAVCRLGPEAAAVLPDLRALAPVVPPRVLEGDLWRATLVRLGVDASEFDKPANRGGTDEQYRERLVRRGCRT
jgi:hypothetical protein